MRSLILVLCISLSFCAITKDQVSDFFMWSGSNGNNVIVLRDGTVATVGVQWVGLSAWYDQAGITSWYNGIVAKGQIPYFHDYGLGTLIYGGRDISYGNLLAFDTFLAKLIGTRVAFVNLDTEWGKQR